MFLKSFTIYNYRKYGIENNSVHFEPSGITHTEEENNILLSSTLIIGQNNAGKTSVITALKKASGADNFKATDFNFEYLYDILNKFYKNSILLRSYLNGNQISEDEAKIIRSLIPEMKFLFEFQLDSTLNSSDELLTNIAPLIYNEITQSSVITACVRLGVKEEKIYLQSLYDEFANRPFSDEEEQSEVFDRFLRFLSTDGMLEKTLYTDSNCTEEIKNFKMQDLVEVDTVSFEKLHTEGRLSDAFNKIYRYKVQKDSEAKKRFEERIDEINKNINDTATITKELTERVNNALSKTMDRSHATMQLRSNLTIDNLLSNVIRYVYHDGKFEIPEDQFGMGYTNLMLIIAQLVDYVDNSPESQFRNKINLLLIEEPESYMHPQMQRLLIQNLDNAVRTILSDRDSRVHINCQLIITSHSANIVYGKLHAEDTFDNINYISSHFTEPSEIIPLEDKDLARDPIDSFKGAFEFLKKHIRYNACELFFADACIAVEGVAEETILPFYIDQDEELSRKYISILSIGGSHAQMYFKLFKALKIPVAVITDIDLVDNNDKKTDNDNQIVSVENLHTANNILKLYNNKYSLGSDEEISDGNIHVFTQAKIGSYYPTTFEEALILTNSENEVFQKSYFGIKPEIFQKYCSDIKGHSHLLLHKIENKKGEFARNLLFNMVNVDGVSKVPNLPSYIQCALDYIRKSLAVQTAVSKADLERENEEKIGTTSAMEGEI